MLFSDVSPIQDTSSKVPPLRADKIVIARQLGPLSLEFRVVETSAPSSVGIADVPDFSAGAAKILAFLEQRLHFETWALGRLAGDEWIVVETAGCGCKFSKGDVFEWRDTLCHQMLEHHLPNIAPDIAAVPEYAQTPLAGMFSLRSFIGLPIRHSNGSLFGTLIAVDTRPAPDEIAHELPLLELFAGLLGSLLDLDSQLVEQMRESDTVEADALRDPLTGLHNRAGWQLLAEAEAQRALRHGLPMTVLSIDLDGLKHINDTQGHHAGDHYIRLAAQTLRDATRPHDVIVRLGGDEFVCLLVDFPDTALNGFMARLEVSSKKAGISLSVGAQSVQSPMTMSEALKLADKAMYEVKRTRPNHRGGPPDTNSL